MNSNFEFVVCNCWHVNVPVCTTVLIDLFTERDGSSLARSDYSAASDGKRETRCPFRFLLSEGIS